MVKKKTNLRILHISWVMIFLFFSSTCKKIELVREILLKTDSYTMGTGTVQLSGTIIDAGEGCTDHGFYISESSNPQSGGLKRSLGSKSSAGSFSYNETDLQGGKTYHYQAYAEDENGTKTGDVKNFYTEDLSLSTQAPIILSKTSATLNGSIENLGFETLTDHGFYWSQNSDPQNGTQVQLGSASAAGLFSTTVSGLSAYTDYFFIVYVTYGSGTTYGDVVHFRIENVWIQLNDFEGSGRNFAFTFTLGDKGYIGGGYDGNDWLSDLYQYNPSGGSWTTMQGGPVGGITFITGNKAYVYASGSLYEYDPDLDVWNEKTLLPGIQRRGVVAFGIGDKGYVACGSIWDGSQRVYLNDVWEFKPRDLSNGTDASGNPMGSWTRKTDFPGTLREFAAGFSVALYGYVCSGYNSDSESLNDLWEFNPMATTNGFDSYGNPMGTWTQKPDYPGPAGGDLKSFVIANRAYVFKSETWQYNPISGVWTRKADFAGQVRLSPVGFAIGNRGYMGTGERNSNYLKDFWEYLPELY